MTDEQHDRTPDTAPAVTYCTTTPVPGTFLTPANLAAPCEICGHAVILHIGAHHCPVCEMVDLNAQERAALAAVPVRTITVGIDPAPAGVRMAVAEQAWADVQRRHREQQDEVKG